jgi:hypothetical protein
VRRQHVRRSDDGAQLGAAHAPGFLVRSYRCSDCGTERPSQLVPDFLPYFGLAIGRSFG